MTEKKNVTLRISNKQYQESLKEHGEAFRRELSLEDQFEIITEGTVYARSGSMYLSYEESEDVGLDNSHTVIKVQEQVLDIRRYGKDRGNQMDLHLEQGVMNVTRYHMPMAHMELEVFTNKLTQELDENGFGRIYADYNIRMEPLFARRNHLTIEVMPS